MAVFNATFYSESLMMQTNISVIIPECETAVNELPVVYLLHGLSDNATNWLRRTSAERYADATKCVLVVPEVQRSFYIDMKNGLKYFSFVTLDLPKMVKRNFNLTSDPKKTYVAGLSMGGYGALKCGLTYPESYAGVAAFSSACDLEECFISREKALMTEGEKIGILGADLKIEDKDNVFVLAEKVAKLKVKPKFFLTCGTEDAILSHSHKIRDILKENNFDLSYQEWEDGHSWGFWDISLQLALDYFFGDDE